jgi:hypothetical protein
MYLVLCCLLHCTVLLRCVPLCRRLLVLVLVLALRCEVWRTFR